MRQNEIGDDARSRLQAASRKTANIWPAAPKRGMVRRTPMAIAIFLLVAVGFAKLSPAQEGSGRIFALLVGVGRQPPAADWSVEPLLGTANDQLNMKSLLEREFGVPPGDIVALADEQATLARVREEFARLARLVGPRDSFIFHFSGHGTRVPDDDGDEQRDQPGDLWDEALCLYDVGLNMEGVLRDDELGRMLDDLNCAETTVVLDCCHSGTATKGLPRPWQIGRMRFVAPWIKAGPKTPELADREEIRDESSTSELRRSRADRRRIVFTACTDNQSAWELRLPGTPADVRCGSLTLFLVEGLRGAADSNGDGSVSNQEARDYVARRIDSLSAAADADASRRQTPQLEAAPAAAAQAAVLGGRPKRPLFALATPVDGQARVRLDMGLVQGLKIDQRLAVFRVEDGRPVRTELLADIEVDVLDTTSAEAKVVAGGTALVLDEKYAASPLIDPLAPPDLRLLLRVAEQERSSSDVARQMTVRLTSSLANEPSLRVVETNVDLEWVFKQERLGPARVRLSADLWAASGWRRSLPAFEVETIQRDGVERMAASTDAEEFLAKAVGWFRREAAEYRLRKIVGELRNPNPSFGLRMATNRVAQSRSAPPRFAIGDPVKLAASATVDCHVQILAISPSGKLVAWTGPDSYQPRLSAGESKLFPGPGEYFRVDEQGIYVIKLIATRNRLNRSLVQDERFEPAPFASLKSEDWAEYSLIFESVGQVRRP